MAVRDPRHRERLEIELEVYGQRTYVLFAAIVTAAELEPSLVGDEVVRNVVRLARRHAADLRPRYGLEEAKRLSRRPPWI